jgi:hypothetical protein
MRLGLAMASSHRVDRRGSGGPHGVPASASEITFRVERALRGDCPIGGRTANGSVRSGTVGAAAEYSPSVRHVPVHDGTHKDSRKPTRNWSRSVVRVRSSALRFYPLISRILGKRKVSGRSTECIYITHTSPWAWTRSVQKLMARNVSRNVWETLVL